MWNAYYGHEPLDLKLLAIRLFRKWWILVITSILGVVLVGGPYFLYHVVYGPVREYEAVMDFYIDYAKQSTGEEYTYFNQTTWTQLMQDDVFIDKIEAALGTDAAIDAETLRSDLQATMLSDTRIVTTTVTTTDPELTMQINDALITAFEQFGDEQKEIADVRILQQPQSATLVALDVRTLRACILGLVIFDFVTLLYMLLYVVLDDSIYIPSTFEKRYGVPMLGTLQSEELRTLAEEFVTEAPWILVVDESVSVTEVEQALMKQGVNKVQGELTPQSQILLVVKAGAHNGKLIEKELEVSSKKGLQIRAALLWEADEKLISAYYLPEHVLSRHKRIAKKSKR